MSSDAKIETQPEPQNGEIGLRHLGLERPKRQKRHCPSTIITNEGKELNRGPVTTEDLFSQPSDKSTLESSPLRESVEEEENPKPNIPKFPMSFALPGLAAGQPELRPLNKKNSHDNSGTESGSANEPPKRNLRPLPKVEPTEKADDASQGNEKPIWCVQSMLKPTVPIKRVEKRRESSSSEEEHTGKQNQERSSEQEATSVGSGLVANNPFVRTDRQFQKKAAVQKPPPIFRKSDPTCPPAQPVTASSSTNNRDISSSLLTNRSTSLPESCSAQRQLPNKVLSDGKVSRLSSTEQEPLSRKTADLGMEKNQNINAADSTQNMMVPTEKRQSKMPTTIDSLISNERSTSDCDIQSNSSKGSTAKAEDVTNAVVEQGRKCSMDSGSETSSVSTSESESEEDTEESKSTSKKIEDGKEFLRSDSCPTESTKSTQPSLNLPEENTFTNTGKTNRTSSSSESMSEQKTKTPPATTDPSSHERRPEGRNYEPSAETSKPETTPVPVGDDSQKLATASSDSDSELQIPSISVEKQEKTENHPDQIETHKTQRKLPELSSRQNAKCISMSEYATPLDESRDSEQSDETESSDSEESAKNVAEQSCPQVQGDQPISDYIKQPRETRKHSVRKIRNMFKKKQSGSLDVLDESAGSKNEQSTGDMARPSRHRSYGDQPISDQIKQPKETRKHPVRKIRSMFRRKTETAEPMLITYQPITSQFETTENKNMMHEHQNSGVSLLF
uniref:Shugoshin_C domain-containing protein n=1 Tax=Mesocestoides corti TaxID=53468 RepID=A0A5K3ENJ1_MESCO